VKYPVKFTVFTPTFNRAHTLDRVYLSLAAQTFTDFEWVIVDDGSTDNTKELVMSWQSEGKLQIRYVYQVNHGKPIAHNRAVLEARGELFLPLDSDDACVPNALERLLFHWQNIPLPEREGFSGVTCQCVDAEGRLVGTLFPADVVDSTPMEMYLKNRVKGEKWGFHKTEVLRKFPFPQFDGEKYVPEGLVWNRIGKTHKMRFVNEGLRIYDIDSDGVTASIMRIRARSPRGMGLYYRECLDLSIPIGQKLKALTNYIRCSLHAGISLRDAVHELDTGVPPLARLTAIPFGSLLFKLDRIRLRSVAK
jgi:glycosyltransferase involved in cell wall biosynthesis